MPPLPMSLAETQIVFRPPRSSWILLLLTTLIFFVVAIGSFILALEWWYRVAAVLLASACPVSLAELATQRVQLEGGTMTIVDKFRRRTLNCSEISKVTWAKGMGVAVQLLNGEWVKLPPVGTSHQGVTNTIRAWVKRTQAAKQEST